MSKLCRVFEISDTQSRGGVIYPSYSSLSRLINSSIIAHIAARSIHLSSPITSRGGRHLLGGNLRLLGSSIHSILFPMYLYNENLVDRCRSLPCGKTITGSDTCCWD